MRTARTSRSMRRLTAASVTLLDGGRGTWRTQLLRGRNRRLCPCEPFDLLKLDGIINIIIERMERGGNASTIKVFVRVRPMVATENHTDRVTEVLHDVLQL